MGAPNKDLPISIVSRTPYHWHLRDPEMLSAPEIVMPADAPTPDFVQPCPQETVDLYNKIWTRLKQ
ncbi:MAG TPA: hypothetical protein DCL95_06695 [Rhodospirillaceae bacterium]|nr:hypothetical protein [Rhodospirillaceae bacterium]HAE00148.1 hypothetical protein [Rhodospirillaceae bacterium]HAJ19738.1 hypothetical protein [Rhodospirillaceae bacterium]|tara:strand:- start:25 stop:222 length:198 start_codon:yes stop_codon:yes gene_type:complete